MTKPAVLCISKSALEGLENPLSIQEEDLHFINRKIVDDLTDTSIGELFPQVIPSIAMKVGDRYLSYARNGNETRLHGSRSMTLGGHIDVEDYITSMLMSIPQAAMRELDEEVGLSHWFELTNFTDVIYIPVDPVSKVHVGLFTILRVDESDILNPSDELHDIMFLTKEELQRDLDQYEEWSKYIINNLI